MCGRINQLKIRPELDQLGLALGRTDLPETLRANLPPTATAAVIRTAPDGVREAIGMRWGLLPVWAGPDFHATTFNARLDKLDGRLWAPLLKRRQRCLVPIHNFYEWTGEKGAKQPWAIGHRDGSPLVCAGLWERNPRLGRDGGEVLSFTVVTHEPNALAALVHDRMPVVLLRDAWSPWLDPAVASEDLTEQLAAEYPADRLRVWPVSKDVNVSKNERGDLAEPVGPDLEVA